VEWLFRHYWAAAVDPATWRGSADPAPDDLDVELVRLVYGLIVESVACGTCGASLDPPTDVEWISGWFTAARIVVTTRCRGPRRHRHRAKVVERAGDLRLGRVRPA
jgi:hypothetical protein